MKRRMGITCQKLIKLSLAKRSDFPMSGAELRVRLGVIHTRMLCSNKCECFQYRQHPSRSALVDGACINVLGPPVGTSTTILSAVIVSACLGGIITSSDPLQRNVSACERRHPRHQQPINKWNHVTRALSHCNSNDMLELLRNN